MFVTSPSPHVSKCKDCQTVLTDDYVKLEGQPIVDQYEPEDKESLVSIYCDILRKVPDLDPKTNVQYQFEESVKSHKQTGQPFPIEAKITEFNAQLKREISLVKQNPDQLIGQGGSANQDE